MRRVSLALAFAALAVPAFAQALTVDLTNDETFRTSVETIQATMATDAERQELSMALARRSIAIPKVDADDRPGRIAPSAGAWQDSRRGHRNGEGTNARRSVGAILLIYPA